MYNYNVCEAFHASFSTNFYSPHPNIFVFLKVIIETQTSTYIAINSIEQEKYISNRAYLKKKLTINSYISINTNLAKLVETNF